MFDPRVVRSRDRERGQQVLDSPTACSQSTSPFLPNPKLVFHLKNGFHIFAFPFSDFIAESFQNRFPTSLHILTTYHTWKTCVGGGNKKTG